MMQAIKSPANEKMAASFRQMGRTCALAILPLVLAAGAAQAQRPDVRSMTCAQTRTLVQSYNGIVLNFTNTTYDRVVRNRFACPPGMTGEQKYTQTLDMRSCMIGYICVQSNRFKKF